MKKSALIFFFSLFYFSATSTFAATVVEYGVPIVVQKDVYTVAEPNYYYYEGHRCYTKERPDLGVNFLGLKAGIDGSSQIYCYPYP